jgi:tight adherence protein B
MSPAVLIGFVMATTLVLILGVGGLLVYGAYNTPARRRLAAVKAGTSTAPQAGAKEGQIDRRRMVQAKLKEAEARRQKKGGYKLREAIIQAGLEISPWHLVAGTLLLTVVGTAAYYFAGLPKLGLVPVVIILGFGVPKLFLRILIRRRLGAFAHIFADAIDVVVRGVKAGLPIGECIAIIGREMPDPVGLEFRLIAEGTRIGMTLDDCLERAVQRVPIPEFRFFGIVLSIQRQTGGNLADTLSKLSDVLRGRKKMRDKVKAMSAEAKSSAMIIGSLPIIVGSLLALIAPDYVGLLFTTNIGHFLVGGGLTWMAIGILVMRQMINFEM